MKNNFVYRILFGLTIMISSQLYAEAIYPPPPDIRPLGMQQGNVGSCMAEAQVFAMENAFQVRGMAVSLSTFNAHAFNWRKNNSEESINQIYSPNDPPIFNHFGRFVPAYMLPEDGRGFKLSDSDRMPISAMGLYDFEFPSAAATGQSDAWYSFKSGYTNTIGFEQLKNHIRQGHVVTLSLQGRALSAHDKYDINTGLVKGTYSMTPISSENGINHAVALVGFDDDLYEGKGAFIIRNSWNENMLILPGSQAYNVEYDPKKIEDKEGFKSFRGKINPVRNEVGYLAVPYQYVRDLISAGEGGATVFGMDFNAFFKAYEIVERKYEIQILPFYCKESRTKTYFTTKYALDLKKVKSNDPVEKAEGIKILTTLFSLEYMSRSNVSIIQYAKLSKNTSGTDRAHDLYLGKFRNYYCAGSDTGFGPSEQILNHMDYKHAITRLSTDPRSIGAWLYTFRMFYDYFGGTK